MGRYSHSTQRILLSLMHAKTPTACRLVYATVDLLLCAEPFIETFLACLYELIELLDLAYHSILNSLWSTSLQK